MNQALTRTKDGFYDFGPNCAVCHSHGDSRRLRQDVRKPTDSGRTSRVAEEKAVATPSTIEVADIRCDYLGCRFHVLFPNVPGGYESAKHDAAKLGWWFDQAGAFCPEHSKSWRLPPAGKLKCPECGWLTEIQWMNPGVTVGATCENCGYDLDSKSCGRTVYDVPVERYDVWADGMIVGHYWDDEGDEHDLTEKTYDLDGLTEEAIEAIYGE